MDQVKYKVAIVTESAGGLGRTEDMLPIKEGAKVVVTDVDVTSIQSVAAEVRHAGGLSNDAFDFKGSPGRQ